MSTSENSVLRALLLLQLLSSTRGSTARKIFEEIPAYSGNLQVLERDIQIFEEIGFKLEKNFVGTKAQPQISYQIDPTRKPGLLMFPGQQNEELLRLALLLAQNSALPPLPLRDVLQTLVIRQRKVSLGAESPSIKDCYELLLPLFDAISTNKQVQVQVSNPVHLDPLYLACLNDMELMLICWNHSHQAYEEMRLDEIKNILVLDQEGGDHHPTSVRFVVERAYLASAQAQHWISFSPTIQEENDWINVQATGYVKARILWQINELGPHVELLEPEELRNEIIASLKARFQMYLPPDT